MADADTAQKPETTGDSKGQAELFAGEARGRALRLESMAVDPDQVEQRFGAGRPKGARNLATMQRLEMIQRICGDPVLASARIVAMQPAELAGLLGCTMKEALDFQQRERFELLPYTMSKAPVDLNVNKRSTALHLHFPVTPGARPGGAVGALALLQQAEAEVGGTVIEGVFEEDEDNAAIPTG